MFKRSDDIHVISRGQSEAVVLGCGVQWFQNVSFYCDSALEFGWQVQAVLLLLGGREIPPGMTGANATSHHHHKVCLLMTVFIYEMC